MDMSSILPLLQNATELGLICSLTVLALYLSYSMLNVCDLSTDGCYTLGAVVGGMVVLQGHPYLAILAAMGAGILSGLLTAFLQTYMGIDSLLAGIIVNTGLWSINIHIMGGKSLLNLFGKDTVFSIAKNAFKDTPIHEYSNLVVIAGFVILAVIFLSLFLKTRLGLAIRATGNNPAMVKSSSINPAIITIIGLGVANAFTALSGCLMGQSLKSFDINIGTGMVTIALASLLIGHTFFGKRSITTRAIGVVIGSVIFRLVYALALRMDIPSYMLRLVSSVIVIIFIAVPYLKKQFPLLARRMSVASKRRAK